MWHYSKNGINLTVKIKRELYDEFKKLCKQLDWDISKRTRYLIWKDIQNLKKQAKKKNE